MTTFQIAQLVFNVAVVAFVIIQQKTNKLVWEAIALREHAKAMRKESTRLIAEQDQIRAELRDKGLL